MPALSASNSILNLDTSWSSFLRYLSTCKKNSKCLINTNYKRKTKNKKKTNTAIYQGVKSSGLYTEKY